MNSRSVVTHHVHCYCFSITHHLILEPKQMLLVYFHFCSQCLDSGTLCCVTHCWFTICLSLYLQPIISCILVAVGLLIFIEVAPERCGKQPECFIPNPLMYKAEVSRFTDPQGRCATSPDTSLHRILLGGVWSALELKCVFTCPRYCWHWQKQEQPCTYTELVRWCPGATQYTRSVWSSLWFPLTVNVFSFFEALFHISCIIARREKKTHSPHRLWPTNIQNWSFVLFLGWAILQTIWRRKIPCNHFLFVLLCVINSSGPVLTWSRTFWVTVCPCSTSRAPPPRSISTTAKMAAHRDWARTSSQVHTGSCSAIQHPDNITSSPDEGTE